MARCIDTTTKFFPNTVAFKRCGVRNISANSLWEGASMAEVDCARRGDKARSGAIHSLAAEFPRTRRLIHRGLSGLLWVAAAFLCVVAHAQPQTPAATPTQEPTKAQAPQSTVP